MPIPSLVTTASQTSHLPPGRHVCTEDEIVARFVQHPEFAASASRAAIWQQWLAARALLQSVVTVHAAWISGSFTTSKPSPRDIDVTYVINERERAALPREDRQIVESYQLRVRDPLTRRLVPSHGMPLVDTYLLSWEPHHLEPNGTKSEGYRAYAEDRGYWDDWWSRYRSSAKKSGPLTPADAVPRRGYLEVNFDAYA